MILYHISEKYLGKKPLFVPRVPKSAGAHEGDTLRICVAPRVSDCYLALELDKEFICVFNLDAVHVYQVETEDFRPAASCVRDKRLTSEKWLLKPHRMQHVLKMPKFTFQDFQCRSNDVNYWTRRFREMIDAEFDWRLYKKSPVETL